MMAEGPAARRIAGAARAALVGAAALLGPEAAAAPAAAELARPCMAERGALREVRRMLADDGWRPAEAPQLALQAARVAWFLTYPDASIADDLAANAARFRAAGMPGIAEAEAFAHPAARAVALLTRNSVGGAVCWMVADADLVAAALAHFPPGTTTTRATGYDYFEHRGADTRVRAATFPAARRPGARFEVDFDSAAVISRTGPDGAGGSP